MSESNLQKERFLFDFTNFKSLDKIAKRKQKIKKAVQVLNYIFVGATIYMLIDGYYLSKLRQDDTLLENKIFQEFYKEYSSIDKNLAQGNVEKAIVSLEKMKKITTAGYSGKTITYNKYETLELLLIGKYSILLEGNYYIPEGEKMVNKEVPKKLMDYMINDKEFFKILDQQNTLNYKCPTFSIVCHLQGIQLRQMEEFFTNDREKRVYKDKQEILYKISHLQEYKQYRKKIEEWHNSTDDTPIPLSPFEQYQKRY